MSAVAVALALGGVQQLTTAKNNHWTSVPFVGTESSGTVSGSYVWAGQSYTASWAGSDVPSAIQINGAQPSELRVGGTTAEQQRAIGRRMLLLSAVILAVTWFITYAVWTRGQLIKI
jgi:hypothetical protein